MGAVVGLLGGLGFALVLVTLLPQRRPTLRRAGWLDRLVAESGVPRATRSNVMGACLAAAVIAGGFALIVTAIPVVAFLAMVLAASAPLLALRRRAHARRRLLRSAWPDAVDQLVSAVRAGMSLPESLAALGYRGPMALRPAFVDFEAEYRATGSFSHALDRLQDALADPVADRVVASLRIAREVGGTDLGLVLRTLSVLLREDARTRGEIESRQSWTISAARLAAAAPWITLLLLLTRPQTVEAYRSATGALILLVCAVLTVVAYHAMLAIGRLPEQTRMVRT